MSIVRSKPISVLLALVFLVLSVGLYLNLKDTAPKVAAIPDCTAAKATDFKCWRDHYQQLVADESPEAALADAHKQYKQNSYIKKVCHQVGHVIGRAAAKKYNDISTAYQHGDDFCASGYYHGVLETVVEEIGVKNIVNRLNDICAPLNKDHNYKLSYYNCVHGLGHGLMAVQNNRLFTALKSCSHLQGEWEQNSCYSGVFMENVISEIDPDSHSDYLKKDDPVYPCNAVANKYKYSCYNYQTSHMVIVYNYNFAKVFKQCQKAGPYSTTCYSSLGRDVSGYTVNNAHKTKETCLSGPNRQASKYCISGAVKDFIWQHRSLEKGKQLCRLLDKNLRQFCNSTAESYYSSY